MLIQSACSEILAHHTSMRHLQTFVYANVSELLSVTQSISGRLSVFVTNHDPSALGLPNPGML